MDTVFLLREWAGVSNIVMGWYTEADEVTTVRMICPLSSLSYVFSILPNGNIKKVELDQFPGQVLFSGNHALVTIGEENDLIFMHGVTHLHIERSGRFTIVCYQQQSYR